MVSTVLDIKRMRYAVVDMGIRKGTPRLGKLMMKASTGWNAKAEKGVEIMNLHICKNCVSITAQLLIFGGRVGDG